MSNKCAGQERRISGWERYAAAASSAGADPWPCQRQHSVGPNRGNVHSKVPVGHCHLKYSKTQPTQICAAGRLAVP